MSQVIRIPDNLYKRLEKHASGFDTPANVIERVLDAYEEVREKEGHSESSVLTSQARKPATKLEIEYFADSEEGFKKKLLSTKVAYIKLHYTDGESEIKEWNASRFTQDSRVDGNLRSGYLRGWKERGIYKAELSVNRDDFA